MPSGVVTLIGYHDLAVRTADGSQVQGVHRSLQPWWDSLPADALEDAITKLEVVQEVTTGFRYGHAVFALPGEPFPSFRPGVSERQRVIAMAENLSFERSANRQVIRRVNAGEIKGSTVHWRTVYEWVRAFRSAGFRGLVDGRRTRARQDFEALDPRYRAIVDLELRAFDGAPSMVNKLEIQRRVWVALKVEGLTRDVVPERLADEYLAWRIQSLGRHPREHRSNVARSRASTKSAPVTHPSHVCMDVTRADNLVFDELHEAVFSVEITTVISMSTAVVLALRVTPRSANSVEAGLALYDTMRPFSMTVSGTDVGDWRWAGIPRSLSVDIESVRELNTHLEPSLQGEHRIPGLRPTSLRTDHGSIFVGSHFQALLREFEIDFLPSRIGASTDNAVIERWHETLQRGLQQIAGYKGRNAKERGRHIIADQPLLTATELETHLRRFVALDYHRDWHEGLQLPSAPHLRLTPLMKYDCDLAATGTIDVPQRADLIYQFLPVIWLTPGNAGVEHRNLRYDAEVLKDFRTLRKGTFRADDSAAPFHIDPRDVSRLWFRHPETDRIHEIPWRGAHLIDAPMTDKVLERAIDLVKARGGNKVLKKHTATQQIIDELGEITAPKGKKDQKSAIAAARVRFESSRRDHREASTAASAAMAERQPPVVATAEAPRSYDFTQEWPNLGDQPA
jgi:transposase InsO family protein